MTNLYDLNRINRIGAQIGADCMGGRQVGQRSRFLRYAAKWQKDRGTWQGGICRRSIAREADPCGM